MFITTVNCFTTSHYCHAAVISRDNVLHRTRASSASPPRDTVMRDVIDVGDEVRSSLVNSVRAPTFPRAKAHPSSNDSVDSPINRKLEKSRMNRRSRAWKVSGNPLLSGACVGIPRRLTLCQKQAQQRRGEVRGRAVVVVAHSSKSSRVVPRILITRIHERRRGRIAQLNQERIARMIVLGPGSKRGKETDPGRVRVTAADPQNRHGRR